MDIHHHEILDILFRDNIGIQQKRCSLCMLNSKTLQESMAVRVVDDWDLCFNLFFSSGRENDTGLACEPCFQLHLSRQNAFRFIFVDSQNDALSLCLSPANRLEGGC